LCKLTFGNDAIKAAMVAVGAIHPLVELLLLHVRVQGVRRDGAVERHGR
jgi:hypothetical protein